jgi:hypothetical protein
MSHPESIEIDAQLGVNDVMRANYAPLLKGKRNRILVIVFALIFIVFPVVSFILESRDQDASGGTSRWLSLMLLAIVPFAIGFTYFLARRSFYTNKSLQETFHYTFTEAGIDAAALSSSSRTSWENVWNALETRHDFFLFISDRVMYAVPKRCFTEEDIEGFRTLLRSQLKTRAKIRK